MKITLRKRIFIGYLVILGITLFGGYLILDLVSQTYFELQKTNQIVAKGDELAKNYDELDTEAFIEYLERTTAFDTSNYMIMNKRNGILYSTRRYSIFSRIDVDRILSSHMNKQPKLKQEEGRVWGIADLNFEDYQLLVYYKIFNDGYSLLITETLKPIGQTVAIMQPLLLGIFLIMALAIIILTYFLARNITKPIEELTNITEAMSDLNFKLKYMGSREDEIGTLGKSVNQLASELEQTIFRLEEELAKEKNLDKMRKQFVAKVSHELKTPLTIASGYIEAIEDGVPEQDELEGFYTIIKKEIQRMSTMVKELLDLASHQSGSFRMKKREMDLGVLLNQIYSKFKETMNPAIQFTIDLPREPMHMVGDPIRLEQAVSNLLSNSLKHVTENDQIFIRVKQEESAYQVTVGNTGPKIEEKEVGMIWEAFYQSKDNKKKGLGLGLAITKEIISQHGGQCFARNTAEGVEFGFMLPINH
ncbi:sensor histidine kinase [Vallitalea okinawensis]|uniref:sensor histidine kinase n=1 Tax=Vallitalea okinawensis TaxID=2078660 RepID=UPI000CFC7C8C|nr:HAMP domain-containing sensor histidine kinase [Vallitalea okinawensis]